MADEKRQRAVPRAGVIRKSRNLGGEIDEAASRTVKSDETIVSTLCLDSAVRENDFGELMNRSHQGRPGKPRDDSAKAVKSCR